jgi:hypothetical protein
VEKCQLINLVRDDQYNYAASTRRLDMTQSDTRHQTLSMSIMLAPFHHNYCQDRGRLVDTSASLPLYFRLLPLLTSPSAHSLVSRHRTAVATYFHSPNDAGCFS